MRMNMNRIVFLTLCSGRVVALRMEKTIGIVLGERVGPVGIWSALR